VNWIKDPQALMPGTRMPAFYDFSDPAPDGPEDVLGGDDQKQVEALRDYILTLHGAAPVATNTDNEPREGLSQAEEKSAPVGG